jgi:hypothetical protein
VDERGGVALNRCNMKTAWLILGVLFSLAVAGCKPKEQVIANKVVESEQALITGQIFIVTKGRANVVLGDEKIALLDAHETRTFFNSKAVEWSNALAVAQVKVDKAATIYDALYRNDLAQLEALKQYWERQDAFELSKDVKGEIRDLYKEKKTSAEKKQFDDALEAQARLWDEINWPSPKYFEPSIAITTTDSEGRFKFVVPKTSADANMTLLAKAEREAGDEKEKYWWTVNVNLNGRKTDEFILSNDNKDSSGVWGWFDDKAIQNYMVHYTVEMEAAKRTRENQDWLDNLNDGSESLRAPRTLQQIKSDLDSMENVLHTPTPEEIAAARAAQEKANAEAKAKAAAQKQAAAARALRVNQDAAAKGDMFALLRMGERYRDGDGVEKDLAKARDYLQKAADAGSPTAKEELSKLPSGQ